MSEIDPQASASSIPSGQSAHEKFTLRKRTDAPVLPGSDEMTALVVFRASAKRLKTAETEFRAAQQAYAEAVKALSDEAVK